QIAQVMRLGRIGLQVVDLRPETLRLRERKLEAARHPDPDQVRALESAADGLLAPLLGRGRTWINGGQEELNQNRYPHRTGARPARARERASSSLRRPPEQHRHMQTFRSTDVEYVIKTKR